MLRPLLEGAFDWVPPGDVSRGAPVTHFGQRAAERGALAIPGDLLKWAVERAISEGREDLAEPVFSVDDAGARLYRVILPDGVFYPVVKGDGHAVTIYTPDQVRSSRRARRNRNKHRGCRARRVPADG